jgi:hypothetical protein
MGDSPPRDRSHVPAKEKRFATRDGKRGQEFQN